MESVPRESEALPPGFLVSLAWAKDGYAKDSREETKRGAAIAPRVILRNLARQAHLLACAPQFPLPGAGAYFLGRRSWLSIQAASASNCAPAGTAPA